MGMANPDHVRRLCEGARAFNAWRDQHPDIVPDLAGIELTLGQRQLGPSNGGPINLGRANLERAMLRHATLVEANLKGACLRGADLARARLNGARLDKADLTDAMLDEADLQDAILEGAVIAGASLAGVANFTRDQLAATRGRETGRGPAPGSADQIATENRTAEEIAGQPGTTTTEDAETGFAVPDSDDPFELLGLEPSAKPDDIRAAYRQLAKLYHPDINPGKDAELRFKLVTEAYRNLLSPPESPPRRWRFYRSWAAVGLTFALMMLGPSIALLWFLHVPLSIPLFTFWHRPAASNAPMAFDDHASGALAPAPLPEQAERKQLPRPAAEKRAVTEAPAEEPVTEKKAIAQSPSAKSATQSEAVPPTPPVEPAPQDEALAQVPPTRPAVKDEAVAPALPEEPVPEKQAVAQTPPAKSTEDEAVTGAPTSQRLRIKRSHRRQFQNLRLRIRPLPARLPQSLSRSRTPSRRHQL